MLRISPEITAALLRVREDKTLTDWLQANLDAYRDDTMMQRDDTALRIAQGKAQGLHDLLSLIADSPDLLTKQRRDKN